MQIFRQNIFYYLFLTFPSYFLQKSLMSRHNKSMILFLCIDERYRWTITQIHHCRVIHSGQECSAFRAGVRQLESQILNFGFLYWIPWWSGAYTCIPALWGNSIKHNHTPLVLAIEVVNGHLLWARSHVQEAEHYLSSMWRGAILLETLYFRSRWRSSEINAELPSTTPSLRQSRRMGFVRSYFVHLTSTTN